MRNRYIIIFSLLALLSIPTIYGEKKTAARSGREMARHFFHRGNVEEANGRTDAAYEYSRKALMADTGYVDAAFSFGAVRMMIDHDTLASHRTKLDNLNLTRKLIDAYPADFQAGMLYSQLASVLDTLPETIRVLEILEKNHPKESVIQIYKSNAYGAMGMTDSAINAIRKYERLEGMTFETSLRKLRYRLMDDDTIGAIGEIDELIAKNHGNSDYISYKAKVYQMLEMNDSAFKYFSRVLELNPDDGVAQAELADIYAQRGDSAAYDSLISKALISENLDLSSKTQILAQYLQRMIDDKSDLGRSDLVMAKLAEQYPHEPEVLFISAKYSAAKKDYKEAIRQIDYAIKLDGTNPEYLNPKMSYLMMDNRPAEALKIYEEAKEEGKELSAGATMVYVSAAQEAGLPEKALNALDSLIRGINPAVSLADTVIDTGKLRSNSFYDLFMLSQYYQMAGDIYHSMDNLPETFRCYRDALAIFPDNDLALNNFAYFLVEKGGFGPGTPEFAKAKEMSAKSVSDTADNGSPSTYLDTYAWILFKEKDYEEAEKYQRMAVEEAGPDADDMELFSHFGDILYMNGKAEEALKQWEKALKIAPDNELLKKKVTHKTYFEK